MLLVRFGSVFFALLLAVVLWLYIMLTLVNLLARSTNQRPTPSLNPSWPSSNGFFSLRRTLCWETPVSCVCLHLHASTSAFICVCCSVLILFASVSIRVCCCCVFFNHSRLFFSRISAPISVRLLVIVFLCLPGYFVYVLELLVRLCA